MVAGCILWALLLWAEFIGFYLLSTGHVGTAGLLAGGPVAGAAAVVGFVLHRRLTRGSRPRERDERAFRSTITPLPRHAVAAGRVLPRPLAGGQRRTV